MKYTMRKPDSTHIEVMVEFEFDGESHSISDEFLATKAIGWIFDDMEERAEGQIVRLAIERRDDLQKRLA